MTINTIRNNTGQTLELWDVGNRLASLSPGGAIHTPPTTITSVTCAGISYHNRRGGFEDGDSYAATFVPAAPPQMAGIQFTGNQGIVLFT